MSSISILGALWTVVVLGGVPLQSLTTRRTLELHRPPRLYIYGSTAVALAILGILTLFVDREGTRPGLARLWTVQRRESTLAWTAGTLAACLLLALAFLLWQKVRGQRADATLVSVLPGTVLEHNVFVAISLLAGLVEEYVYRGFCLAFLIESTGSRWTAVALVTVGFGLAHIYQGRAATLKTAAIGAVLAVPVLATGALLPSILAHAAFDILAGFSMKPLLKRWDLIEYGEWIEPEDGGDGL
ncbi:MAG: CPBP family intramembrane metalloprotease [Acidobacteriota bacterium]|nr:CPBP family intramembrane metalloprotease [Acidobacteriota bacterium]